VAIGYVKTKNALISMPTQWFDYELPRRLVAQEPLRRRADARLMVLRRARQSIEHHHVRDLPELLTSGDRLVLNDTKVLAARLIGQRDQTGGRWQGLFLEKTSQGHWRILCKTRGRLQPGDAVRLVDREGRPAEKLWLIEQAEGGQWLAQVDSEEPAEVILARVGRVPLPPYIRGGNMVEADVENYQTVFARRPGAVAAPTAGLHFTPELLRTLSQRNVPASAVTLHVGLGTFRPVEADDLGQHLMHAEWGEVTATAAEEMNATRDRGGRLVAVGTTVVRLLETAIRRGDRTSQEPPRSVRRIPAWMGTTDLFIRPPFEFLAIDALLTNFHFPRTTLLLLVQAFAGGELVAAAYEEAIREEYRFYSYGDTMLIL
jgi:S-adenosylmethionine:tRNA ribosyltransferase-isomerase